MASRHLTGLLTGNNHLVTERVVENIALRLNINPFLSIGGCYLVELGFVERDVCVLRVVEDYIVNRCTKVQQASPLREVAKTGSGLGTGAIAWRTWWCRICRVSWRCRRTWWFWGPGWWCWSAAGRWWWSRRGGNERKEGEGECGFHLDYMRGEIAFVELFDGMRVLHIYFPSL